MLDHLFGFRLLAVPTSASAKVSGAPGETPPVRTVLSAKAGQIPGETPPEVRSALSAKVGIETGGEPSPNSPRVTGAS